MTPTVGGSVRMGFGIAFGMLLFSVLVGGAVLFAIAMANGLITWPFADAARRFEGRGPAESAPITLEGPVAIEWSASPATPTACRFGASLFAQNDPGFVVQIASTMVDRIEASGIPRDLDLTRRSDYYLRIESDCHWSVRIVAK